MGSATLNMLATYNGVVTGSAGLHWTSAQLRGRVASWQQSLQTWLKPHSHGPTGAALRLAVRSDNHPELLALDLAAASLGIALVPLPLFFTEAQQSHAMQQTQVCGLIHANPQQAEPFCWQALPPNGINQAKPQATGHPSHSLAQKITFTSGSTGQPKGVVLSWAQQLRVAQQLHQALQGLAIHKHLCLLPWAVLLENIAGLWAPMLRGADIAMPSLAEVGWQGGSHFNAEQAIEAICQHQANSVILMPAMLLEIIKTLQRRGHTASAMPSLRFVAVGGGHVPHTHLQQAAALGLPVYEGYGLSECASVVCLNTPEHYRMGSVGQALPGNNLRVDEHQQLWVKADNDTPLSLGYLGHTTLAPSGPWLATGDIADIDPEGFVFIRGRQKNIIVTSFGRNVSPEWPEQLLLNTGVFLQALVYGQGGAQLCALLVPQPNTSAKAIADAVHSTNASLPDYARIASYRCIAQAWTHTAGLLTANGRLQRQRILEHHHVPVVL